MNRKDTIDSLFARKSDVGNTAVSSSPERVKTGAISAMGGSLKELAEGARHAARLQEQIDAGGAVIDIDTSAVDESEVADRIAAEVDPGFEELVLSIGAKGQQVPILVRPSGERYQVAYGRRRLRACARLGIRVKAIIRRLSDEELVIAQGKENLERLDLSFIEKALFARRLEDRGFDRAIIMAALATEKGDLSRYISIARQIPEPVIHAIGPAGRAGRSRWLALAELIGKSGAENTVDATLREKTFRGLGSDERFIMLFNALNRPEAKKQPEAWLNAGVKAARIERRSDRTILTIDEKAVPDFGRFLADRLDDLYRQFQQEKESRPI